MQYTLFTKDYKRFEVRSKDDFIDPIKFEDALLANGCFNGDKVSWDIESGCRLIERGEHPILSGILELNSKVKYGVTSRGTPMYLFTPYRQEYPSLVVGCSEKDLTRNKLVLVKADEATPSGRSLPRGNLQETLGLSGDPRIERLALLWAYTPYKMPNTLVKSEVNKQDKRREFELRPKTPANTFHIDPPDCKDVDDVISIEKQGDITRVWITISDVAEWVSPGTAIDEYAKKVTATTYENGTVVRPMLPITYSENVCSLLPDNQGLGISLVMDWNGSELQNLMFLKTVVECKRTYTYDQADADIYGTFNVLKAITKSLTGNENPNSHDFIEALMVLYNREVASILRKEGVGILRRHQGTDINKWEEFQSISPELSFLAYKSAEYCLADDQNVYHAGLESDAYCTATSPIRRYADLVNQRILKSFLGFNKQEVALPSVSVNWLNKRQKDLKHFERDIFYISNMLHNEKRIISGIILDWSVIDTNKLRFQVFVPEWKRLIKWTTHGENDGLNRVKCILQQKGRIIETYIEKNMRVRFEIYWNPQQRFWKEKLILRLA